MDEANPTAESPAVKDGRFLAVGSRAEIDVLRGADTRSSTTATRSSLPGFIDGHTHPAAGEWIRGFKYDDTKLAEGRPLNRLDPDEAVPEPSGWWATAAATRASTTRAPSRWRG